MAKWRATVEYTKLLGLGKRTWEVVEVEAETPEEAIDKALLKLGFVGPILKKLANVKVTVSKV